MIQPLECEQYPPVSFPVEALDHNEDERFRHVIMDATGWVFASASHLGMRQMIIDALNHYDTLKNELDSWAKLASTESKRELALMAVVSELVESIDAAHFDITKCVSSAGELTRIAVARSAALAALSPNRPADPS